MQRMLILLALLSLGGCALPTSTPDRPDSYYQSTSQANTESSLFGGDAEVLSDEAIGRILNHKYEPPALNRVALMPFGREVWSSWSEELSLASDELQDNVIDQLMASPAVYDASYLPSILIPDKHTVPYLREAAARYQADLLLVYRSYCRSFEKYRMFGADESRAFCGVEAVLLDTRTGLVPFTSVATRSFSTKQNDKDLNFRETMLKGQLSAVAQALSDVSAEVVRFLGQEDRPGA